MRIKANKTHIFICLFLCSLFLAGYISIFNAGSIISLETNIPGASSGSGGSGHLSKDASTNLGHFSLMSSAVASAELLNFPSIRSMRPLYTKSIFDILTALIAAQIICLAYSSRLSYNICTPFNSIRITYFLHKKDGMK